jgi:hypothetical protein
MPKKVKHGANNTTAQPDRSILTDESKPTAYGRLRTACENRAT